ncbi:hypothetical protein PLICRDRAFT_286234 [Plicaturopsis crispa FD-325 SS-3]|nr:hypothetical protein PLICRDRAFT_286234 [Plicaturopsis crispa FD-325 SS-3]
MHPCLETFDILFLICKLLREEDDRSIEGTHPTLACLARTCRAFSELALDLIWEKQLGVQNLIKCMPPDLWEEEELDSGEMRLTLRRQIQPSDWQSCRRYRDRIKNMSLSWIRESAIRNYDLSTKRYFFAISPELSLAIRVSSPEEGIFPNLETVYTPWTERAQFLSPAPRLRNLHIKMFSDGVPSAPGLKAMLSLPLYFPNVKRLTALFAENHVKYASMACEWASLEVAYLLGVDYDDLQQLSCRLHNLQDLYCNSLGSWTPHLRPSITCHDLSLFCIFAHSQS